MIGSAAIAVVALSLQVQEPTLAERTVPDSSAVYSVVARISAGAMSPFCPGMTIATCPSPQAAILQDSIKGLVVAGWSPEMIESWLVAEYGEGIRASPPWRGLGIVGWTLPYLVLVGAAFLLLRVLLSRRPEREPPGDDDLSQDTRSVIAGEMRKLKL